LNPPSDAWLLARVLSEQPLPARATVLDVCTGSGILAVAAARRDGSKVTAVDVARRAVLSARINARLNRVPLRVLRGDLFAPVDGERFDAIVSNPPYLPAASDELPQRGAARAWDAGRDGRAVLDRICAEAPGHLREGGFVLLVHSSVSGEHATLDALARHGLEAEVLVRERGPLGPILSARAKLLEERGLIPPGGQEEEMLVIRGRRPVAP
jgi:release factor glutamine methyltransferase